MQRDENNRWLGIMNDTYAARIKQLCIVSTRRKPWSQSSSEEEILDSTSGSGHAVARHADTAISLTLGNPSIVPILHERYSIA